MLTAIENKLEELFESIELLPSDKVEAAEKVTWYYMLLIVRGDYCYGINLLHKYSIWLFIRKTNTNFR